MVCIGEQVQISPPLWYKCTCGTFITANTIVLKQSYGMLKVLSVTAV